MNQKLRTTPQNPSLCSLLSTLMSQDCASPFIHLPFARDYPTYYKVVKTPMSLQIMKDKAFNFASYSLSRLREDMAQILENCILFNRSQSQIVLLAHETSTKLENLIANSDILKDGNPPERTEQSTKSTPVSPFRLELTKLVKQEPPAKQVLFKIQSKEQRTRIDTLTSIISCSTKMKKVPSILRKREAGIKGGMSELVVDLSGASLKLLKEIDKEVRGSRKASSF